MKNEYKITRQEMMSWAKGCHLYGAVNIFRFVLWCMVGLLCLGLLTILFVVGGDWIYWYFAILFLLFSIFQLFFSRFLVMANRYRLFAKTYGVTEWIRSVEFTEDEIIVCDHTSVTKLKYGNIKTIKEKNNLIVILFNHNLMLRLYRDAFVEGSWEACRDKIDSMIK
ncbi:MAG: YcxB family protein [Clostridia bacterium]|nr:YcxB family protein [Clostridia bacterium]